MWQKAGERALRATRILRSAEILPDMDDECVEFVKELMVGRECSLKLMAYFVVANFRTCELVAFEDAAGVGVDHEHRMFSSVEQDGIGGFRADAAEVEELFAENIGGSGEKASKRTFMGLKQELHEGL